MGWPLTLVHVESCWQVSPSKIFDPSSCPLIFNNLVTPLIYTNFISSLIYQVIEVTRVFQDYSVPREREVLKVSKVWKERSISLFSILPIWSRAPLEAKELKETLDIQVGYVWNPYLLCGWDSVILPLGKCEGVWSNVIKMYCLS